MREPRLLWGPAVQADGETVSVSVAAPCERPLIERLSQFYIYDFSELEPPGSGGLELGDDGLFSPLPDLGLYWRLEGFHPLLIRIAQRPAGFALVNTRSRRGATIDRNMAEFFVVRKHRRRGVATEAVRKILARYPGDWEVAVAERNAPARAFWPRAIAAAANVSRLVKREGDGKRWRGPIWSFWAAEVEGGTPNT